MVVALAEGASSGSITSLLNMATEMWTWFITQMGTLVTFITSNPIILIMFIMMLSGAVIGMFMRIWRSV